MEQDNNHQALALQLNLCKNCETPLADHQYCPTCGQKSDTHIFTFRELLEEMADGLLNLDSRLWRSLIPLIIHPGRMTIEYLRGRRMYYLPPFRLYLILSVLFFLLPESNLDNVQISEDAEIPVADLSDEDLQTLQDLDGNGVITANEISQSVRQELARELALAENTNAPENPPAAPDNAENNGSCRINGLDQASLVTILLRRVCLKFREDPDAQIREIGDNIPLMMIVGMPLVALFMQLCYMFSGRYYVEHIIFLFHTHAFFFLISIITALSSYIGGKYPALFEVMDWIRVIGAFYIPLYIFLAMLKVYGDGKTKTFFKAMFVLMGYGVSVAIVGFFTVMFAALKG